VKARGRISKWAPVRRLALALLCAMCARIAEAQTDLQSPPASQQSAAATTTEDQTAAAPSDAGSVSTRPRAPWQIRSGLADLVLQPVEQDVPMREVAQTVGALLDRSPICVAWPSLWIVQGDTRRTYIVRYALMERDWGATTAAEGRQRMDEFVDMGFLTKQDRPDIGDGAVEYTLTDRGAEVLTGTPGHGRSAFCGHSERRLVAITRLEWGSFACGNLRPHFTYAQNWPSWARTEAVRARVAASATPSTAPLNGTVSLRRVWRRLATFQSDDNGALQSACYDPEENNRVADNDLDLNASEP
jgi:hypothetical protein